MTTALVKLTELDRYLAEINRYPLLSYEEETELARKWRDLGDMSAAHALVTANLRFVVKIANEYRGYGARLLDLIQEGSIGLMQAVKRFDPDRGYRLLSYAVYWIRSYIHSFLMSTMRMIKIGTSRAHRKLFFKLRALKGKLAAAGVENRDEMIDAVAQQIGVNKEDVEEMDRHLTLRDSSLDAPISESGTTLLDVLPAESPTQEDLIGDIEIQADQAARLDLAISHLDAREREIIEKRYLIEEPLELKELGEQLGISKQRVFQLEHRAIEKLRAALLEAA